MPGEKMAFPKQHFFYLLLILLFPAGQSSLAAPAPKPVIIDTDMAGDDWLAILYLLSQPSIEVKAITISGTGQAHPGPASKNLFHLLDLSCAGDIPVAIGSETPMAGKNRFPDTIREFADSFQGVKPKSSSRTLQEISASELIQQIAKSSEKPVTILSLAPMTNLAQALQDNRALKNNIREVVAMGGAIGAPGNLADVPDFKTSNSVAEWNIYLDPKAADLVMKSVSKLVLIPLDATSDAPASDPLVERIRKAGKSEHHRFVSDTIEGWKQKDGSYYYHLWDTLAAMYLINPEVIETETEPLILDAQPDSITAGDLEAHKDGITVTYGIRAEQAMFEEAFIKAIGQNACKTRKP